MRKIFSSEKAALILLLCGFLLIIICFSKYVFGSSNQIFIEKKVSIKNSESGSEVKKKICSINIKKLKKDTVIYIDKITIKNDSNKSLRIYGIAAENINGNGYELLDDILNIGIDIDQTKVYRGKVSDIVNCRKISFTAVKKTQPNSENNISITLSNNSINNNLYYNNEISFDLCILAASKDIIEIDYSGGKDRIYIGGFYSADGSKYINEFWGECLKKDHEIRFVYNKAFSSKEIEYIVLDIRKHNSNKSEDIRLICFKKTKTVCAKGIKEEDVSIDWADNIITIRENALSEYNPGFDARIGSAEKMLSEIKFTPFKFCRFEI